MKLKKPKEGVMTKKYDKPNNVCRAIVCNAVAEQIDDAVEIWKQATMMFADSYGGASGVTLQVQTPSSWAYAVMNVIVCLSIGMRSLTIRFAEFSSGDLVVRHSHGECIKAEVIFGTFNDAPIVTVALGYLDLKETIEWDESTYDEYLYDEVMRKASTFLPLKEYSL
jgi:hypothetical protein